MKRGYIKILRSNPTSTILKGKYNTFVLWLKEVLYIERDYKVW
jgi:hypothetical protein